MEIVALANTPIDRLAVAANGGHSNDRDVFHVSFDPEIETFESVIVESIATIQNAGTEDLSPLYSAIDPEHLQNLLTEDSEVKKIEFIYEEMEVTAEPSGDIWIQWR